MSLAVGVDVAKELHWAVIKEAGTGQVLASHAVDNTPQAIAALISEIEEAQASHGEAVVGVDLLGGIASLLEAMLLVFISPSMQTTAQNFLPHPMAANSLTAVKPMAHTLPPALTFALLCGYALAALAAGAWALTRHDA